jgi:hypothetical protein
MKQRRGLVFTASPNTLPATMAQHGDRITSDMLRT